jgi:pimeloyl-ACP methyl ester carboxylesterase
MDWIEANGASLRYDLSGSGPETVVLPHEVGGCIESWDDALPAFQRRFRVLRYDQRGSACRSGRERSRQLGPLHGGRDAGAVRGAGRAVPDGRRGAGVMGGEGEVIE